MCFGNSTTVITVLSDNSKNQKIHGLCILFKIQILIEILDLNLVRKCDFGL